MTISSIASDFNVTETGYSNLGDSSAGGSITDDMGAITTPTGDYPGTYGTFHYDQAMGDWTYTLDQTRPATQSLTDGDLVHDSFVITDGGLSPDLTITVDIAGSNDGPALVVNSLGSVTDTAGDDSFAALTGTVTASDPDAGDVVSFSIGGGSATLEPGFTQEAVGGFGTLYIDAATGAYKYVPNDGAVEALTSGATDSFTIVATDSASATDTQTFSVTLNGANDAPVLTVASLGTVTDTAADDTYADLTGTIGVSDRDASDTHSFSLTGGSASVEPGFDQQIAGTYGTLYVDSTTGAYKYVANDAAIEGLNGAASDSFGVTVTDGLGLTDTQTFSVSVAGTNDTPTLGTLAPEAYNDTPAADSFGDITGTLSAGDRDTGDTRSFTLDEGGPDTSLAGYDQSVGTGYGQLYLNGTTGAYLFVPDTAGIESLTGTTTATFHFTVTDGSNASATQPFTIAFNGTNDIAVVGGDVTGAVTEDAGATLSDSGIVTIADADTGENVFQAQTNAATTYGSFSVDAGGNWTYNADNAQLAIQQLGAGATLTDSFIVHSADDSASEVVTVTITGVNDTATVGGDVTGAVTEDANPIMLTDSGIVTASDVDAGQSGFQAVAFGSATFGNYTVDALGNWTYQAVNGQAAIQSLGVGETLTDSFVVHSADNSASETVTVTITGTNDTPNAVGDVAGVDNDQTVQVAVLANDTDVDAHDTLTVIGATVTGGLGTVAVNADNSITYDPGSAYAGLASDQTATVTISYTVSDGNGGTASADAVITVHGGNQVPVIVDPTDTFSAVTELADHAAGENSATLSTNGVISFADVDSGDVHSVTVSAQSGSYLGNFSVGAADELAGNVGWSFSVNDAALNTLAQGQVVKQFYDVTIDDGNGGSVTQTVEIDLVGTNDAAHLSSANFVLPQGSDPVTKSGQLTITDEDGPAQFAPQVSTAGQYGHLTVAADGQWNYVADQTYNLAPNQFLTDVFTVLAADGTPTTVAITISGVDHPAVAQQDVFFTDEASSIGAGLSLFADNGNGADSDPDGGTLQISAVNGSANAVGHLIQLASGALLQVNADGTFTYNPNHAFDSLTNASGAVNSFGFDQFTYTLAGGTTTTAFINVSGLASAEDVLVGNAFDNAVTGFETADSFLLQQGGSDSANGLGGDDGFYFGGALDAGDNVDGGTGNDTLAIQGDTNVVLGNVSNVEVLLAMSGSDTSMGDTGNNLYSYDITTNDGNVAAGAELRVIGTGLLAGENMHFDGSAEQDGNFAIFAGQGVDDLTGGRGSDGFFFGADGNLTGADHVDGGAGVDTLALRGDYTGGHAVTFTDGSFANVEVLALLSGHTNEYSGVIVPNGYDYDVTTADGNVAAGARLDVNAAALHADESVRFDGRAETDGSFRILSGGGDDTLYGGAKGDTLYGGFGADRLEGGAGADVYTYRSAAESTSTHYDSIVGFDYREDVLDLPGGGARAFSQAASGSLSTASFDSDLTSALNGVLGAGQAALFTATDGSLSGHVFAVVDANGVAGYQAGEDFVIDMVSPVVPIDPHATVIA